MDILKEIDPEDLEYARSIREDLHRHPELAFAEHDTAKRVVDSLRKSSVELAATDLIGTGVVGLVRGVPTGPTVALRADMDALPITEETGLAYASENPGVMHACGHDGHTAIALTVARILARLGGQLPGSVKFIFQPAEEQGNGADHLVRAGVLSDSPAVDAVFGLHARPQIQAGQIELAAVPSAASNPFSIRIQGRGTHAAYPHEGIDPIAIGAQIVCALQQVVSRRVAPSEAAVLSIGSFQAGQRGNIIPDEALLRGTIRTRDPKVCDRVTTEFQRMAQQIAEAMGARCQVDMDEGTPRVRNDDGLVELVRRVGIESLGKEQVLFSTEITMGAEDFSFYLREQGGVPGCLFWLGVDCDAPIHSPTFDFGVEGLRSGILMMANIAIRFLSGDNQSCA